MKIEKRRMGVGGRIPSILLVYVTYLYQSLLQLFVVILGVDVDTFFFSPSIYLYKTPSPFLPSYQLIIYIPSLYPLIFYAILNDIELLSMPENFHLSNILYH